MVSAFPKLPPVYPLAGGVFVGSSVSPPPNQNGYARHARQRLRHFELAIHTRIELAQRGLP